MKKWLEDIELKTALVSHDYEQGGVVETGLCGSVNQCVVIAVKLCFNTISVVVFHFN